MSLPKGALREKVRGSLEMRLPLEIRELKIRLSLIVARSTSGAAATSVVTAAASVVEAWAGTTCVSKSLTVYAEEVTQSLSARI